MTKGVRKKATSTDHAVNVAFQSAFVASDRGPLLVAFVILLASWPKADDALRRAVSSLPRFAET